MSKRLAMLEKMTAGGAGDAFAWYALANEYKSLDRFDEAIRTFQTLREREPSYVPQYLICGTMLLEAGRSDEARDWLSDGLPRAQTAGDAKAVSELQEALERLSD